MTDMALRPGDRVRTPGQFYGTVVRTDDDGLIIVRLDDAEPVGELEAGNWSKKTVAPFKLGELTQICRHCGYEQIYGDGMCNACFCR